MKLKMGSEKKIHLLLLLVSISFVVFSGCARSRNFVIHPISEQDIFEIKKGTNIAGTTTEFDGWYVSDFYLEKIAEAKVETKKLGSSTL